MTENPSPANWPQHRVLVTGCTGLLGSWLTRELVSKGATVVGLVRDRVPQSLLVREGLIGEIIEVRGELADRELLARTINEYEIDVVFHLAAQAIVGTANRNPISTFSTNISGSWNLFEACRAVGTVRAVVVASSDKAYGAQTKLPYVEEMPLRGEHPYDVSKSCTDLLARTYHVTYELPVCVTRCGNFFGGGDLNFNRIVPGTIRSALFGERPIIRSDGKFVRDYIYVRDVVDAYLCLAQAMQSRGISGEAFNVSAGTHLDVLELTRKILDLMDRKDLEPEILNRASGEIRDQYLCAKKIRDTLGWESKFGLDEALRETIGWYRKYLARQETAQ